MFLTACHYYVLKWTPVMITVPTPITTSTTSNKTTFDPRDAALRGRFWIARNQLVADRNRHNDRMERSFYLLFSAVLSRKERQARRTFSTGVLPALHDQALHFETRRNRQTMRSTVLPVVRTEGGERSHQRLAHAKNLPLLRTEGGARSLHRMRSRHALLVDLPVALEEMERRVYCRQAFQGVLPNIREKVAEKQRMKVLLSLAGRHEKVMASIRAYRRYRTNRTYPRVTKTAKPMGTVGTTDTQDQAIFFLLFFVFALFWVAVFFIFRQVAIKTNKVVTDFVKETERVLSILEKKHDVTRSRRRRRVTARQEKKRSKHFATPHYVFLKH